MGAASLQPNFHHTKAIRGHHTRYTILQRGKSSCPQPCQGSCQRLRSPGPARIPTRHPQHPKQQMFFRSSGPEGLYPCVSRLADRLRLSIDHQSLFDPGLDLHEASLSPRRHWLQSFTPSSLAPDSGSPSLPDFPGASSPWEQEPFSPI